VDTSIFEAILVIQHRKRRLPTRAPAPIHSTPIRRSALVPVRVFVSVMTSFCFCFCFAPAVVVVLILVSVLVLVLVLEQHAPRGNGGRPTLIATTRYTAAPIVLTLFLQEIPPAHSRRPGHARNGREDANTSEARRAIILRALTIHEKGAWGCGAGAGRRGRRRSRLGRDARGGLALWWRDENCDWNWDGKGGWRGRSVDVGDFGFGLGR
jgi:hypothetical protein